MITAEFGQMTRAGKNRMRIQLILLSIVVSGSIANIAEAQGFGAPLPPLTNSQARAWMAKLHLIVDENSQLVAAKVRIEHLWTENQKLSMPGVLGDNEHQASLCAGLIEDQFETTDHELEGLSELLTISGGMETNNDQISVSSAVWVHARASRGTVGVFKVQIGHFAKQCEGDAPASKQFSAVKDWAADTIPILSVIENEASLLSGLPGPSR